MLGTVTMLVNHLAQQFSAPWLLQPAGQQSNILGSSKNSFRLFIYIYIHLYTTYRPTANGAINTYVIYIYIKEKSIYIRKYRTPEVLTLLSLTSKGILLFFVCFSLRAN